MTIRILRVCLAHEDEQLAPWVHRPRCPPLPAIYDDIVALANDPALDVRCVRGGDIRLRHRETGTDLSIQKRTQPSILLFRSAVAGEDLHVPGIRRGAVEDLWGPRDAAHDFAERRVLEVGEPGTKVGLGKEQVPEPRGPGLRSEERR